MPSKISTFTASAGSCLSAMVGGAPSAPSATRGTAAKKHQARTRRKPPYALVIDVMLRERVPTEFQGGIYAQAGKNSNPYRSAGLTSVTEGHPPHPSFR